MEWPSVLPRRARADKSALQRPPARRRGVLTDRGGAPGELLPHARGRHDRAHLRGDAPGGARGGGRPVQIASHLQARSISHRSPCDRVGAVNADP
eukprot:1231-Pelagococcus_subviridis.AAC.1